MVAICDHTKDVFGRAASSMPVQLAASTRPCASGSLRGKSGETTGSRPCRATASTTPTWEVASVDASSIAMLPANTNKSPMEMTEVRPVVLRTAVSRSTNVLRPLFSFVE